MTERGKGLGKGGAKRHRKVLRDNIQGITKPAIRGKLSLLWMLFMPLRGKVAPCTDSEVKLAAHWKQETVLYRTNHIYH